MTNKNEQQIATFVHGSLFALHMLGAVYNYKTGGKKATIIHTVAGAWDLLAALEHNKWS